MFAGSTLGRAFKKGEVTVKRIAKRLLSIVSALIFFLGIGMFTNVAAQPAPGVCGAMDLVFVVDDTGSMGGTIANLQAAMSSIIADAEIASGGDLNLALTSFKDEPETDVDLPSDSATVSAAVASLFAAGGAGGPEASDVALDAVVNGAGIDGNGAGCGDLFNAAAWRPGAVKIAVMMTDNLPGGCNDIYTPGVDDLNADRVANDASAAGILISAVYNSYYPDPTIEAIMMNYAATTGGQYVNTPFDGFGTADAISEIIADCGSSANDCPLSQGFWKNHPDAWPVADLVIGGMTYSMEELMEILRTPPKKGNSNLILAHQLIAALLNIANGSDASVIADAVADAQSYLTGEDLPGDYQKDKQMNAIGGDLDYYNNRWLTPDCEESAD